MCAILCYVNGQTSKYLCCFCAEYWNLTASVEALRQAAIQAKESAAILLHWNKCRWRWKSVFVFVCVESVICQVEWELLEEITYRRWWLLTDRRYSSFFTWRSNIKFVLFRRRASDICSLSSTLNDWYRIVGKLMVVERAEGNILTRQASYFIL